MPAGLLDVHGATVILSPFTSIFGQDVMSESCAESTESCTVFAFAISEEHSEGCFGLPSSSVPGAERSGQLLLCTTAQRLGTEILAPRKL